jgi:DNA-binding CsgD family transcriptional regulator
MSLDRTQRRDLTARELEVLRLLAIGCTCSQVATRLGISHHTVATHIKNAYRKLGVHTAAAAVFRAMNLMSCTKIPNPRS